MTVRPPRLPGVLLGLALLALTLGAALLGAVQLAAPPSPLTALWIALPSVGLPLAAALAYRLYGLLTARYHVDRDGFRLRWGAALEQAPLAALDPPRPLAEVAPQARPRRGLWWPGCVVGERTVEGLGRLEFFATTAPEGWLLLSLAPDRHLVLSPPDPEAFHQAFVEAMQLGSLEPLPARSHRPDFFAARLWRDPWARAFILAGWALPVSLLAFLTLRLPTLPPEVPFGFTPTGAPGLLAPPTRLLLLPLIGGLCWLVDLGLGLWLYRGERERPLAYGLWAAGALVGGLLWGAALRMLAAA